LFPFFSFYNINLFAKNINIDGINDWAVITDTFNIMDDNLSIVIDNDEWIWKDRLGDSRTNSNYTSDMSDSVDLREFRVTASTTSLFFFIRFKELNASSEGYMYPHIQIAIGIENNSDRRQFLLGNYLNTNNPDIVTVSENAGWSSLLEIFQTEKTTNTISSNNNIWRINSSNITGNSISYYQSFATKMARVLSKSTTSNFIEIEVNYISMGISDFYSDISNKLLKFSVAVDYAALPFDINISTGYVKEYESDSSNIVDCISITSGTINEINDDILNHYFEIKFDNNAKIIPDSSLPYFQDNKIYIDNKSESKDVYYSALVKPIITWEYGDDNSELQTGVKIQIGDDNIWSDTDGIDNGPSEMWNYSLSCSTEITSSSSELFNPIRYSGKELLPGNTYYIRSQLINTRGYASNWLTSFFYITKSAINLSLGKDDMYIDWNNPFLSGSFGSG